jgi:flagellar biosynthetic protein FliR
MDDLPALLHELPNAGFGLMLVIARVGTTLLTGPALGDSAIPATVRAALAVVMSVLVFPLLQDRLPPLPEAVPALIRLLAIEIVVGAWLGLITRILVIALATAGNIISYMIGLSSVLRTDPSLGVQEPALQSLMALAAVALLFVSGLYVLPIEAVIGSYDVVRPGAAFDAGSAAKVMTCAASESFSLAVRLAAPFVIICLVWQVALGFVSRLVPNIQVHVISAPAQILGGLALLATTIAIIWETWSAGMQQAFSTLPGL